MSIARWLVLAAALPVLAAGGARVEVSVHLDRPQAGAEAFVQRGALPAPGTPGAADLLPQLVRNASFEMTPPVSPLPLPEAWGDVEGWDYVRCGSKRVLVRRKRGADRDPLVLADDKRWGTYRLSLVARKIDGPGGFCVLFEVSGRRTHLRWTLGALGNGYHVLEKVRGGEAERLGPPVVGRIEAGRCYKIEVWRRRKRIKFALNGHLIHSVRERMPDGGIGLAGADARAEYFDIRVHGGRDDLKYQLDHPAEARRSTVAAGWHPLRSEGNDVAYKWDFLYPFNSYVCQSIKVRTFQGGDAGICQHGVPVTAGATYRGRLHVRCFRENRVVVSLRGRDGTVYARQVVGEPAEEWKRFEIALQPSASDPKADFCITTTRGGIVWVDDVSLVKEGSAGAGGLRRGAVAALRERRPQVLLWPVGPGAAHYDWRDGVGAVDHRPVTSVVGAGGEVFVAGSNAVGTNEVLALCDAVGAEPMIVTNPVFGMRPALYWLQYCNGPAATTRGKLRADHGRAEPYGVVRWAIAGLPYDQLDPRRYAEDAAKTVAAMREQDPSVRVLPLLWEPDAMQGRVAVEGAPPSLRALAARRGKRIVTRLVHLGEGAVEAVVRVAGLGEERLAEEAEHLSIDGAAKLTRGTVAVADGSVRVTVEPWTTHVVVLRLEGKPE